MGHYLDIANSVISQKTVNKTAACPIPGKPQSNENVIHLLPMRHTCQAAGHCLALTREMDCELYLMLLGWCRRRNPK
jgi:hypothetical protein